MECEGGLVTEDKKEALKVLEDCLSYPPRFQIKFEYDDCENASTKVTVTLNGISYYGNPPTYIITLRKPSQFLSYIVAAIKQCTYITLDNYYRQKGIIVVSTICKMCFERGSMHSITSTIY